LGVAFLLERLDRRIRESKDLEKVYGLPLLGVVPESAAPPERPGARPS
jgi:capsular polysaccharide biosynthesis protein